jgi:signal transduction histidine kinase
MAAVAYRFILYFVKVNYSKHLQKISEATRKVAKGDFSVEIELDENLKDNSYINIMFRDFNLMVAELNSIESLKDDFISNVSHEIKTPLSVINNYTTALKDKDLPEKLREEYIEIVIESTEKLSDLVTNVLRLSKIENRKILPEKKEYDLCRQLSDCALSFEEVWEEKNIEFIVEMEDRAIINDNFVFLDIIWHNLLSNAFKFLEDTFGDGQELLVFVTELTINIYTASFISRYGCEEYFKHSKELLIYTRHKEIIKEIEIFSIDD